jgi:thiamine biosynthesis lipoprotein
MTAVQLSRPEHAVHFPALGTTATLIVTDRDALLDARALLEDDLAAIDRACSRFRADSELTHVNNAHGEPVRVSMLFLEALDVALRAAQLTDGRVDPTIGRVMKVLGYDRDFAHLATDGRPLRVRVRPAPGWKCIRVDRDARTVRVPDGVEMDFGATAKALAAQRAASRVARVTGSGVLVSLGGDCALAGPAPAAGWHIRIADTHDADPSGPGPVAVLHAGGLATSGTLARRWTRGERSVHHIVDPESGEPAREVWCTASVAAASCVDANIASTAAIVLGEEAPDWLTRTGLPARLVRPDGRTVYVGSWPAA